MFWRVKEGYRSLESETQPMSGTAYNLTMKPEFLKDIQALHPKEMRQVMDKLGVLVVDPFPNGNLKKQLKYMVGGRKLHRLRSGDYRIFYTFDQQFVSILVLRRRTDDTYDEDLDAEFLGGLATSDELITEQVASQQKPDLEKYMQPPVIPLPEPITVELLERLQVPAVYHPRLLQIHNQDALLNCPGVDDETLLRIDAYLFETPLREVQKQPDLVLNELEDLVKYKEGELLGFLLKLSPEQEKYVEWALTGSGPTLVKGGPGTGKSTIALYRVRSLLRDLRARGLQQPRVLFTTYTNALVNSSSQLLKQLLGPDAAYVTVRTADSIIYRVVQDLEPGREIVEPAELRFLLKRALKEQTFTGTMLQQQMQRQTVERLGVDYLLDEINTVIVARQLGSAEEYVKAARPGRKVRLNAVIRGAIWKISQRLKELLAARHLETWQQRRDRAATLVQGHHDYHAYDAVIIDEAQDLDPAALSALVDLCKASNRIFVTADANQSIYGSGFRWSDVHERLRFQGRTGVLHANYRSTREIGEAAQSYLAGGEMEPEQVQRQYINEGPMPDARAIATRDHEALLVSSFFRQAIRSLRLTISSCAILCPTEVAGQDLAEALGQKGIEARFMRGNDLDLGSPGVKILTLKSAKGLEFPIVALAGFLGSNYPVIPKGAAQDEIDEILAKERRTLFVGMTRAMRALLIALPDSADTPVLRGFEPEYWNLHRKI